MTAKDKVATATNRVATNSVSTEQAGAVVKSTPKVADLPLLDAEGLYRIPLRFYFVLILLLRPYLCWIVTLTLPTQQRDILRWIYPDSADFIQACVLSLPILMVVAALTQRVPYDRKLRRGRAKRFWFACWRQTRWLLLLVAVIDLYWTLGHLPDYVALYAPWLLIAPVALGLSIWWLWRDPVLPKVFAEWPADKEL